MSDGPAGGLRLEMRAIRKSFGSQAALDGVSLEVRAGEVHAIVGENGAGKSTLMKVLSGAHQPDGGQMWLDGTPYAPAHPQEARQRGVGMIYQELSIAPHLSVAENISLGREPRRGILLDRAALRSRAQSTLAELGHGQIDVDAPAGGLSISQQQIVEIARSLAMGCRVIVFDEPTSSLAQADVQRLYALIDNLSRRGLAVIYISHFLEEVRRLATRLTVLRDGRSIAVHEVDQVGDAQIVAEMVGRDIQDLYPRSVRKKGAVALEAILPDIGPITLHYGEILGLCGLVGAGRTEILQALFGLELKKDARIRKDGHTVGPGPRHSWAARLGFVSENRKEEGLALSLSIGDNVCLPALGKLGRLGFLSPARRRQNTGQWIQQLDIRCQSADQNVGNLSGGNQQKAAFARLLEADCEILLLDEPTRGIDIAAKAKIYATIDRLVTDPLQPRAIIMVSSYLPELLGVCDRIAVVRRGKIGHPYPVAETSSEQLMQEATRLS